MPRLAALSGALGGIHQQVSQVGREFDQRQQFAQKLALEERETARREREFSLKKTQIEAEEATAQAKKAQAELLLKAQKDSLGLGDDPAQPDEVPTDPLQQRMQRLEMVAKRLADAGDIAGAHRVVKEGREEIKEGMRLQAFQEEQGMLEDLIEDGTIPEEVGSQLQQELEISMKDPRGRPGQIGARVDAIRKAAAKEQIRQEDWAKADQEIAVILENMPDTVADKQGRDSENTTKTDLRTEYAISQSPSFRRKNDPHETLASIKRQAIDAEGFAVLEPKEVEALLERAFPEHASDGSDIAELGALFRSSSMKSHMAAKARERGERGLETRSLGRAPAAPTGPQDFSHVASQRASQPISQQLRQVEGFLGTEEADAAAGRKRAEREGRGFTGRSSEKQNSFPHLPKGNQAALEKEAIRLAQTPGGAAQVRALFEGQGIDVTTIPRSLARKLVPTDDLDGIFSRR